MYYVDTLVFNGLIHPADGERLRSIMTVAQPQLLPILMCEAFAIGSNQCNFISQGLDITPTHAKTLVITVRFHCNRKDISAEECAAIMNAIQMARSQMELFEIERNFYAQLLTKRQIISRL